MEPANCAGKYRINMRSISSSSFGRTADYFFCGLPMLRSNSGPPSLSARRSRSGSAWRSRSSARRKTASVSGRRRRPRRRCATWASALATIKALRAIRRTPCCWGLHSNSRSCDVRGSDRGRADVGLRPSEMPGRRGHAEGRREEPDRAVSVGADKAYDTAEFVRTCKAFGAEAHAARNTAGRRSNIGEEMAASEGYRASQVHRKRIEEVFGWLKTGRASRRPDIAAWPGLTGSSPRRWPPTT